MKNKKILISATSILMLVFIILGAFMFAIKPNAAYKYPAYKSYELEDNVGFTYETSTPVSELSYGAKSAGMYRMNGNIVLETTFTPNNSSSVVAYGATGDISIDYKFNNGTLVKDDISEWAVYKSNKDTVNGIELENKIGYGVAIVQRRALGSSKTSWETVAITENLLSSDNANVLQNLYTIPSDEYAQGMYYRTIVAYKIRHKVNLVKYTTKECVEVYGEFFVAQESDNSTLTNVVNEKALANNSTVESGFTVNKNSLSYITVTKPDGTTLKSTKDHETFTAKGKYTIKAYSLLGKAYSKTITISKGLDLHSVSGSTYESLDSTGYLVNNETYAAKPSYGSASYSSLYVALNHGSNMTNLSVSTSQIYGVSGSNVYLLFKLDSSKLGSNWSIQNDSWGKVENQKVNGVLTGEVATGALILEKSTDGKNWSPYNTGSYKNGIFTTDYQAIYGADGCVCIYVPAGSDILNGVSLRVSYAYEAANATNGQLKNFVDQYTLTLCNDEVDSVTFHNLSVNGTTNSEKDDISIEASKKSETLVDGSMTVTGFEIDKSLNPTVKVEIKKNSQPYTIPSDNKITETGKYEIKLTSLLNTVKTLTIYVNTQSADELFTSLFGDGFIQGKRIFSQGNYPVFEGGLTSYNIKAVQEGYAPVFGYIKNLETEEIKTIEQGTSDISETLTEPGFYMVELCTNLTYKSSPVGDNHKITFRFEIIEEGTAPGPVLNQELLEKYATNKNASNVNSIYYGVTYASASKGNITFAFADYQSAYDHAYNKMKDFVEGPKEVDGKKVYYYSGNHILAQKEKYESGWDLADAISFFTEQAVQRLCFDMTNDFTYATLSDEVLSEIENPRKLELANSVVLFAEGEHSKLIAGFAYPVLNNKKVKVIIPGREDLSESNVVSFKFIRDEFGYDSNTVVIIDSNGNEYPIEYNKEVEKQLADAGCPTGIVTITEKTIYGDEVSYKAVFFNPGDVTTELELTVYDKEIEGSLEISQENSGEKTVTNAFSFKNATDNLDPYALVKVKCGNQEDYFSINELSNKRWQNVGDYEITVVNRIGYSYTYTISIEEQYFYSVEIKNDSTGNSTIDYVDGDTISLPNLTRYGYNFGGYKAEDGAVYSGEVAAIMLKGTNVLEVVWNAKQFNVSLLVKDSSYGTINVEFGKTYTLPELQSTETEEFVGWISTGNASPVKSITIEKEGDISYSAMFKTIISDNIDTDTDTSVDTEVDTDTDIDTDTDESTDTNTNIDTDTNVDTSTDVDTDTDTSSDTDIDTSTDTDNDNQKPGRKKRNGWAVFGFIAITVVALFLSLFSGEGTPIPFIIELIVAIVFTILFFTGVISAWWINSIVTGGVGIIMFVISILAYYS